MSIQNNLYFAAIFAILLLLSFGFWLLFVSNYHLISYITGVWLLSSVTHRHLTPKRFSEIAGMDNVYGLSDSWVIWFDFDLKQLDMNSSFFILFPHICHTSYARMLCRMVMIDEWKARHWKTSYFICAPMHAPIYLSFILLIRIVAHKFIKGATDLDEWLTHCNNFTTTTKKRIHTVISYRQITPI